MHVTVYVELVIFNNFAVDILLEVATLTLFRKKIKWWRVLFAALLGASVATVYPLCQSSWQIVIRVLLAPVMVLIFDRIREKKRTKEKRQASVEKVDKKAIRRDVMSYLKRLFVFCLITYFIGGVTYGVDFAFGIDVASYWQFGVVSLALLTLLITVRLIVMKFSKTARKICPAKLSIGEHEISVNALCDSGNELTDNLSGLPVVIMSSELEKSLEVNEDMYEGFVDVKTVSGVGSMPIVRLDGVEVRGHKFTAYAALSRQEYADFEVILQNSMF